MKNWLTKAWDNFKFSFFPDAIYGTINSLSLMLILLFSFFITLNFQLLNQKLSDNATLSSNVRGKQPAINLGEEKVLGISNQSVASNDLKEIIPVNRNPFTGEVVDESYLKKNNLTPIAVMIDNSSPAWGVQQNINSADIVYEAVTEAGITRLMGIYYSVIRESQDLKIMPVRSIRNNFLDNFLEYNNLLLYHVGGAYTPNNSKTNAVQRIFDKNIKSIYFYQGQQYPIYTEAYDESCISTNIPGYSCKYRMLSQLQEVAINNNLEKYDWEDDFVFDFMWQYAKPSNLTNQNDTNKSDATKINYSFSAFSKEEYRAKWTYDMQTKEYKRFTPDNRPRMDQATNSQISFTNVIVLEKKHEFALDELSRSYTESNGIGIGSYFSKGKIEKIIWSKQCDECRTRFYSFQSVIDENSGEFPRNNSQISSTFEIVLNPGRTWISIINEDQEVEYE